MRAFIATLLTLAAPAVTPALTIQAADMGPAFRGAHPAVLGMDGAFSLPLRPGRSVWIFGDTLLGRWAPGGARTIEGMPPNTAAWVDDAEWVTGFPHAAFAGSPMPAAVLQVEGRPASRRAWPLDLARGPRHTWLYFVEIEATGQGALDFAVTGAGVARQQPGQPLRFTAREPLWGPGAPAYGSSVLAHDGWLYCYAGGTPTRLARVRADRPDEAGAYAYWTGSAWSADAQAAAALPGSGPELSVRWNAYLGRFLMVYLPPFAKAAVARLAPAPEGPWGEPIPLFDCQPSDDAAAMFYGAKQHAELDHDGGRQIVVSYNTNVAPDQLAARPDLYWPRLVRVTFGR